MKRSARYPRIVGAHGHAPRQGDGDVSIGRGIAGVVGAQHAAPLPMNRMTVNRGAVSDVGAPFPSRLAPWNRIPWGKAGEGSPGGIGVSTGPDEGGTPLTSPSPRSSPIKGEEDIWLQTDNMVDRLRLWHRLPGRPARKGLGALGDGPGHDREADDAVIG